MTKAIAMWTRTVLSLFFLINVLQGAELSKMDALRSKILTSAVSFYFNARGYGKVDNITVDTAKKTLNFTLLPEGEKQPLSVEIGSYTLMSVEKEEYLVLHNVQTNRVWLNRIFADHMEEGIKVPLGAVSKGAGSLLLKL